MMEKAYVVVVGLKPGVYREWSDAAPYVLGVSQKEHQSFMDWDEAVEYYERAHISGATRTVSRPPPPPEEEQSQAKAKGGKKQPEGRCNGGRRTQRRRKCEDSPAGSIQAATSKGSSTGRVARDAQIAAALTEARKNRVGPSASSPSVISSETMQMDKAPGSGHVATLAESVTKPAYHPQPQVQSSPMVSVRTPSRPARGTVELPPFEPEPGLESRPCTPETKITSSGPASDIPTNKTQTRILFENSPGLPTPRYAQSLSYASPSPSVTSSNMRTHISSPSSFSTCYFPEDWLARQEHDDREVHGALQSPFSTLSEYATAPNTPETGNIEVGDEDVRDVASPSSRMRGHVGLSELSYPNSRSPVKRSKTWPSAMPAPLPASAPEVISPPKLNAMPTPRRTSSTPNSVNDNFLPSVAGVPPSSPSPEPKSKTTTCVTSCRPSNSNKTEVQIDSPPQVCRCKNLGPTPTPTRQNLDDRVETSLVASPLRASAGVGDIPVRPLPGGPQCRCEHPEYACIHCGQRPRTERRSARSGTGHSRSSRAQSMSTSTTTASPLRSEGSSALSSPAPSGTPAPAVRSSVSTNSSSLRTHAGGHTPIMGPSERACTRSLTARIEASLGMVSFSEAALGVHDVSFDPRSPIQRGTRVPAGTSGSAVRPSPAVVPVPMGSLGLLFSS